MKTLTAREAGRYVGQLERVANELENNYSSLNLSREAALRFAFEIDAICDDIEKAASKTAKLLEGDEVDPEPYMQTAFTDDPGWIEGREANPDETYMETFNYRGNGEHPTQGSQTSVSERTETPPRGLSEFSDGFKRQPSQPYIDNTPVLDRKKSASRMFSRGRYVPQT